MRTRCNLVRADVRASRGAYVGTSTEAVVSSKLGISKACSASPCPGDISPDERNLECSAHPLGSLREVIRDRL